MKQEVPCPFCGADIDQNAKHCKHCGSDDLTGWNTQSTEGLIDWEDDEELTDENKKGNWMGAGVGIVAIVLIAIFLWAVLI